MEEQQRRKQKELDSILDAALDALDDDDDDESDRITSHHDDTGDKYKFHNENQHADDNVNNTVVARHGVDNNCNSGTAPIVGVPYSLEYIANNEQLVAESNISSSSSSKQKHNDSNNSRRRQFGPEPPPPSSSTPSNGISSDPQLPSQYDIGNMMGGASGNEAELAASLESMMKQFTQGLGGMGMDGDNDDGTGMQAMDEMFKQMMANMPTDDVMSSKQSKNNSSQTNPSSSTKSKTTPRKVNSNNNTKKQQGSEPNVDESINRLLDGINQAATASPMNNNNNNNNTNLPPSNMMPDNIDPTQFEQFSEEMMSSIMHEFEKMNNKSDSNDIVDDVMKQLLSKDLMYEPMKEVCTRFPKFLAENKEGMSNEEYEKYGKQYQYFQRIVRVYEVEPNNYDRLMELMQEIQEYGQPPVEIIKDLAPELEFDEEGMPIMNPMAAGGGMPSPMGMMMGGGGNEQCCIS